MSNVMKPTPADLRRWELFLQKFTQVAASYLRRLEELGDPPGTVRPFFQMLRQIYVEFQDAPRPAGMKTVGTFCAMAPLELIEAAGLRPVRDVPFSDLLAERPAPAPRRSCDGDDERSGLYARFGVGAADAPAERGAGRPSGQKAVHGKIFTVADDDISEITAHAYGVRVTAPREYRPGMIIDIGGQDSKIIYLDRDCNIKNFTMNDKCAAGTGKFMEVAAQILETTIDQVGPPPCPSPWPGSRAALPLWPARQAPSYCWP